MNTDIYIVTDADMHCVPVVTIQHACLLTKGEQYNPGDNLPWRFWQMYWVRHLLPH